MRHARIEQTKPERSFAERIVAVIVAIAMLGGMGYATTSAAMAENVDNVTDVVDGQQSGQAADQTDTSAVAQNETGSRLLEESFKNSNFTDSGNWSMSGSACLTARGCSKTQDSFNIQGHDGNGYLQLTDNSKSQSGAVLYNQPVISKNGLHVSFDYYMYHKEAGVGEYGDPADGISFFLTDGAATLKRPGAAGAGLGYATNDEDGIGLREERFEGVSQGVLGIGLDRFGNFSTQNAPRTDVRITGGDDCGQWEDPQGSNSVTVRGKGSVGSDGKWTKGYCIVSSTNVASKVANGLDTGSATNSADDANGKRVDITIAPLVANAATQHLTVKIGGVIVLKQDIARLPDSVKFGFSASTGGDHQVQLIRGLSVYSMKKLSQLDLVKFVDKDAYQDADTHVFKVGDKVPYKFVVYNSGNTQLRSIAVKDPRIGTVTCDVQALAPSGQTQCSGTLTITESLVGENGTFTNTATATATDENGKPVTSPQAKATIHVNKPLGAPEKHKRIKKNGDGSYTVNVDVKGAASSTTVTTTQPIDFTLVLDVSGSMDKPMGETDSTTRLYALQTAVDNFLDGAAAANEGSQPGSEPVRVGLVKFAGNESDNVGNNTCYDGNYGKYYNCSQVVSDLATDMDGLKTTVNQLTAGGATRADYGFQYASKVMDKDHTNAKKVVIFFTDGKPTTGEDDFEDTVANSAVDTAKRLKSAGVTVYSIGIFSDANPSSIKSDENRFMHAVSSNFPNAEAYTYNKLGDGDKDAGYYKAAKNASALNAIFDEIQKSETTTSAYTNVVMEDTLSEYVDLAGKYEVVAKNSSGRDVDLTPGTDYNLTYNSAAKKFVVTFLKPLANSVTYTLEYNVKPTQKAYDEYVDNLNVGGNGYGDMMGDADTDLDENATSSSGRPGFHSNYFACLAYSADGVYHECDKNSYPHPVIQVVSSELHIEKRWSGEGSKPESITVDIKQGDVPYKTVTLRQDENGNWSTNVFIPAGAAKTYTVTETEPKNHQWKASYQHKVGADNFDGGGMVTVPESTASQTAMVVITNHYIAVSALPLTGGMTDRQWLFVGGVVGGLAVLLIGAAGVWNGKKRLV